MTDSDQLKKILIDAHQKGNSGASLTEILTFLKGELPKITKKNEHLIAK
ncbi:hypothetical protein J2T56_001971 [Natronobacillus azotifigens]|uniref:Uncharacterized protein n=1 Tax=Natronobacillus azotifigens TaxID=472978 RepID=A0A9J6REJ6_9BACI|nr:hypothetical protein [Natronobacillus azotifigens]MCZ0703814.1 hypothetical protein [Natronobacillus azotifigens]